MGKGGRGKNGKKAAQPAAADDDDALLNAAIAQSKSEMQQMQLEKKEAEAQKLAEQKAAAAAKVKAEVEAAVADRDAPPLSREDICAKLDALPTFTIVDAQKQFVPVLLPGEEANCCAFWTEPREAQRAIKQAKQQRPDAELAMGTMPLGKAFALCEGWAEAGGQSNFRLRAHSELTKKVRPLLTSQLEQQGMPTEHVFPVFTCEELTTRTVMPFFLSRAELIGTWEELMRQRGSKAPPPSQMTVLDLRFLAKRMQAGGVDWSIVKFLGTDRAFEAVKEAQHQEVGRAYQAAARDDPEAEPPALVS